MEHPHNKTNPENTHCSGKCRGINATPTIVCAKQLPAIRVQSLPLAGSESTLNVTPRDTRKLPKRVPSFVINYSIAVITPKKLCLNFILTLWKVFISTLHIQYKFLPTYCSCYLNIFWTISRLKIKITFGKLNKHRVTHDEFLVDIYGADLS